MKCQNRIIAAPDEMVAFIPESGIDGGKNYSAPDLITNIILTQSRQNEGKRAGEEAALMGAGNGFVLALESGNRYRRRCFLKGFEIVNKRAARKRGFRSSLIPELGRCTSGEKECNSKKERNESALRNAMV
ncbi:MAG: hypothetical protein Q8919_14740 [Bacteroidota bacterium]|nr:hypothetical protein [Bacteroidota bacterium]